MNRLMLDFETLDVADCPVILSMGAVIFNETGIVDCISEKIDTRSCIDLGCTISDDTIAWWDKQSKEARDAAFGGKTNIGYAMGMLVGLFIKYECEEIWSAGALADIRWANNILIKLGMQKPWKYHKEMCFRTFRKYMPQFDFEKSGTNHNALDDAINQAKYWITARHYATCTYVGVDFTCIDDTPKNTTNENERLDRFISDVLDIEGIEMKDIKQLAEDNGFICKLVGGDDKHGSYTISQKFKSYSVAITKCHCCHIHLLEDMCVKCNPNLKDNFLGNGTPIAIFEPYDNELPF